MSFLKNLFGRKKSPKEVIQKEFTPEEYEIHGEQKQEGLEYVLEKMHDSVGHAIIPFSVGGAVDMYYFPNGIEGTGFATMELINPDGTGPIPNRTGTYELVAFTRLPLMVSDDERHPFSPIERRICGIFKLLAFTLLKQN